MVPVADFSLFNALRKAAKKNDQISNKNVIGVYSFEVASLMSNMIQLWEFLNDDIDLSQDFIDSFGIEKLLKDNNNDVLYLIYGEVMYIFCQVARIIVRLAKKCTDVRLKILEHELEGQLLEMKTSWILPFSYKKMDKNIKKMENIVTNNEELYAEMQEIGKLEQKLRGKSTVQSFFQLETQIEAKQLEVSHLKSPLWNTTYDDIVLLLFKCLFTTFVRIESFFNVVHVYGDVKSMPQHSQLVRCQPIEKSSIKRLPRFWLYSKVNRKTSPIEGFARCIGDQSVTRESNALRNKICLSIFKTKLPSPSFGTLGDAKLERIYANAILEIDALVMLPDLITEEKIYDLKKSLPRNISFVVKERLKLARIEETLSVSLEMISKILGWLTPLARNTLTRWTSEQRFAHQNVNTCGEKLLLQVETLCFADKEKADTVVIELLIGLTYVSLAQKQLSDCSSEISAGDG